MYIHTYYIKWVKTSWIDSTNVEYNNIYQGAQRIFFKEGIETSIFDENIRYVNHFRKGGIIHLLTLVLIKTKPGHPCKFRNLATFYFAKRNPNNLLKEGGHIQPTPH